MLEEKLENLFNLFHNEYSEEETSLIWTREANMYDEIIELDFEEELAKLMKEENIEQWELVNCGGFDSPGYDISCYCLSWIDKDNKLCTQDIQFEIF